MLSVSFSKMDEQVSLHIDLCSIASTIFFPPTKLAKTLHCLLESDALERQRNADDDEDSQC